MLCKVGIVSSDVCVPVCLAIRAKTKKATKQRLV